MTAAAALSFALAATLGGDMVRAVRVVAGEADRARYERLIDLRAGTPLDPEAVRRSVERLFATGELQDVLVETVPHPAGGLEVHVRPVRAPLLAEVEVQGDPVLSAPEVRRRARLSAGEPLWPARLDRAARDVAVDLAEQGYLEARVTPSLRAAGAAMATAVFEVAAGERVRVAQAHVVADDPTVVPWLLSRVEPDPGQPYRRTRARAAAESMRRDLAQRRRWRAEVTVEEAYDPAAARVEIVFRVSAGPVLTFSVSGAEVTASVRSRLEAILREGRARGDALEEAREALEAHLRARGHRTAAATHSEEPYVGGLRLAFTAVPGPRSLVASVRFEPGGLDLPRALRLATRPGEPLRDAELEADAERIRRALEARGHVEPRVEPRAAAGGGLVPVVFLVAPGPRTEVEAVKVVLPETAPVSVSAVELRLRPGEPYRVRDLALDRQTLLGGWRNAGYPAVDVTPQVDFSAEKTRASVRLDVAPGPLSRVDRIVVSGLSRTRDEVVRRELLFREGEPLGQDEVSESQRRLAALGLFESVTVAQLQPGPDGHRTVAVRLREAPATTVGYGIGYGERDLLRGSVEVTRRNLFGMDRRLSAFVRMSFRGTRLLATYREPWLRGRRQELFVTAFREEEDREAFDFTRHGITVQTIRDLGARWRVVVRGGFQQIRTFAAEEDCVLVDRQFCPATLAGPSASVVRDTRDDPLDPRRGGFVITDAVLSHGLLGGDSLVKAFVQASTYRLLGPRVLLAVSLRLGGGRTFGDAPLLLPAPERFVAGGDYSLRGFGVDDVRPEGGNALLLGSAELRFELGRGIWAAAFTDAGNVYRLASELSPGDLRHTAGAGLRYRSALGPLRFDWGYKLDRRAGESPYHLHFTVGHAF